ncbi:MAG: hypothetical protein EOO85_30945 [Pedobacter sp.]|nr:MAG: hypothetical protein EOO85_30945 [Pedobacter sp.]
MLNKNGVFKWIIDLNGHMKLVPSLDDRIKHSVAAGNQAVRAAGEIKLLFSNGKWIVKEITNRSGHYIPNVSSMKIALVKLEEAGFDLTGAIINSPDF